MKHYIIIFFFLSFLINIYSIDNLFIQRDGEIISLNTKTDKINKLTTTNKTIFYFINHKNKIIFYSTMIQKNGKALYNIRMLNIKTGKDSILIDNIKKKYVTSDTRLNNNSVYPLIYDEIKNNLYYFNNGLKILNIKNKKIRNIYRIKMEEEFIWYILNADFYDNYFVFYNYYYEDIGLVILNSKNNFDEINLYKLISNEFNENTRIFLRLYNIISKDAYLVVDTLDYDTIEQNSFFMKINLDSKKIICKKELKKNTSKNISSIKDIYHSENLFIEEVYKKDTLLKSFDKNGNIITLKSFPKVLVKYQIIACYKCESDLIGSLYTTKNNKNINDAFIYNINTNEIKIYKNIYFDNDYEDFLY